MIDWEATREKVARLSQEVPRRPDAEVLAERAARVGKASVPVARPTEALEIVRFELQGESFGIEAGLVIEVFHAAEVTPLPHAPAYVRGLTNRMGEILPLFDLAPLLGLSAVEGAKGGTPGATAAAATRCIVIGRDRRPDFGFLVSDVASVSFVPRADLRPLPEGTASGTARDFVMGVTADALIVLDGDRILRDPRLVISMDS